MPQAFADHFKSIAMSPDLSEALERAHGFAREQGHRTVTLEHLLLAFTEDVDASAVLEASNVDLVRLGTDVSGYLGRLLEDMRAENGAEPTTDPELLRVLHAAVQAAQQSRRRQIDGAIVLAAVVGDGKSPAAGLLKAHGLTFEEAIRALQKANAKVNAKARSQQYATPAPAPVPTPPPSMENGAHTPSQSQVNLEPINARSPQEGGGQSVDDILAAARARIEQRAAAIVGKSPEPTQSPQSAGGDAHLDARSASSPPVSTEPDPPAEEMQAPSAAIAPVAVPSPPPPAPSPRSGPSWTPPAAPSAPRLPQSPPHNHHQRPFQQRPLQPGEGPSRPPLPRRAGGPPGGPPQPGLPNRTTPPRAPWPDAPETPLHARLPAPNGALAEITPKTAARAAGQRTGGQGGHGPLVETIPRRMKMGLPASAHVRISRDRIDGLIALLMKGRGIGHRPEALITRALSVRLRAPDGGFSIEAISPETQWVERASGLHQDDQVTWQWTVTPHRRGRSRLVLVVAARTVGHDGIAAETVPPDRVIEVAVSGGRLRRLARWTGLLAALVLGAIVGRFGSELWALGAAIIKRLING